MAAHNSAVASQLPARILQIPFINTNTRNGVVKYSLSGLLKRNNINIAIKPQLKATLGRLMLLNIARWRSDTHRLKGKRKRWERRLTLKCRPYYLPREFTVVFIVAVYIPPSANASMALGELHDHIGALQNKHWDVFFVVAGDFNHVNLTDILPRFHQHVSIATRGNNTLDRVYTNRGAAYRAVPHPHLGFSDHIYIQLVPAHRLLLKDTKPTVKTITVWPSGANFILQDCFERSNWQIFREAATSVGGVNLEEYASSVCG